MYKFILIIFCTLYSLLASANQFYSSEPLAESLRQLGNQPANGPQQRRANAMMHGFASGIEGAADQRRQEELRDVQELTRMNAILAAQLEQQKLELALLDLEEKKNKRHKKSNSNNQINNMVMCFTPPQNCGDIIVNSIESAKSDIYIQAYGFTSEKIIQALIDAKNRGVNVEVILDRSNFHRKTLTTIKQLRKIGIPVYKDNVKGIAHNKVMIIDNKKVITGSFNFTKNADLRNAENVVIITDKEVAKRYMQNWTTRISNSELIF